jgi:tRNA (guanine-N7-)-methyltransferase
MEAHKLGLDNLRVTDTDAVELLSTLPDTCLDEVILEFPDPWHKNKHHKRRLLNAEFAQSLRPKLKSGGLFRLATDWEDYAQQMQSVLNAAEGFQNLSPDQTVVPRPDDRPTTRFEARGARLGHGVWDFAYRRTG